MHRLVQGLLSFFTSAQHKHSSGEGWTDWSLCTLLQRGGPMFIQTLSQSHVTPLWNIHGEPSLYMFTYSVQDEEDWDIMWLVCWENLKNLQVRHVVHVKSQWGLCVLLSTSQETDCIQVKTVDPWVHMASLSQVQAKPICLFTACKSTWG